MITSRPIALQIAICTCLAVLAGCGPVTLTIGGAAADEPLQTTVVASDDGRLSDRVAIIDISGMLNNAPKRSFLTIGENPTSLLHEKLQKASQDRRVKAVLLRLNTPGGTVTASDVMYRQLVRFRRRSGKPIVALMMDVAASGGYYLACAADKIVAHPTTVTGSIGVILQTISIKPALGRIGIDAEAFTSGPNKDAGSLLSKLTDGHRQVLRDLVDDFYQRFVALVRRSRPNIPTDVFDEVVDGRVYSGEAALAVGLVDEVGDLYDAFEHAKQLAQIERAELVMYHRPANPVNSPHATVPAVPGGTQINLAQINFGPSFTGATIDFLYLWRPD